MVLVTDPDPLAAPAAVRRLVVLRHGTAVGAAASDHERDLTEQGRAEAAGVGRWLRAEGHLPDAALVSDARRTRRTWEEVAAAGDLLDVPVEHAPALYSAGPESALDLVRATDTGVGTLLVVGHNPTVASLAHLLHDGRGSERAALRMAQGYPPAAVTVLAVPVAWRDLAWGLARLVDFRPPRP
ncbi:histidine phosphatase family protein [Nocardioides zeae]